MATRERWTRSQRNAIQSRVPLSMLLIVAVACLVWPQTASADGEALFKKGLCHSCHSLGTNRLVGPGLQGITDRRSAEWLENFIASSQTVIKSGDPYAVKLFAEYNNVLMPDPPLTAAEIKEVVAYIGGSGGGGADSAPMRESTPADIALGQELFQGTIRLSNGGPACNSCHNVANEDVFSGGILAKDLTTSVRDLTTAGVAARIANAPDIMKQAYAGHEITEDEVVALVGFLKASAEKKDDQNYGVRLFIAGSGGFVGLMFLFGLFGARRKKHSVNREIFGRQVRSV